MWAMAIPSRHLGSSVSLGNGAIRTGSRARGLEGSEQGEPMGFIAPQGDCRARDGALARGGPCSWVQQHTAVAAAAVRR